MARRAIILVLDGVGIGPAPDTAAYGDAGSDTLGNLSRAVGGLVLPNLQRAGLGNIAPLAGVVPTDAPSAAWGLMEPRSAGKDSTTGHWEMMGLVLDATLTGATWAATPPSGSSVDVDEAATAYTGGSSVGTAFLPNTNDDAEINLADVFNYETRLLRRGAFNLGSVTNTITLVAKSEAAGNTAIAGSLRWKEIR